MSVLISSSDCLCVEYSFALYPLSTCSGNCAVDAVVSGVFRLLSCFAVRGFSSAFRPLSCFAVRSGSDWGVLQGHSGLETLLG